MQNWTKIIKTNVKGGRDRKKNPVFSICAFNYNHKMQNHIPHFKSIKNYLNNMIQSKIVQESNIIGRSCWPKDWRIVLKKWILAIYIAFKYH